MRTPLRILCGALCAVAVVGQEAEILRMLIDRRGEVVSRQDLLRRVWGYVHLPATRTVDNHIARLRKKVERDVENPVHVVTVHGLGYRFESKLLEEA